MRGFRVERVWDFGQAYLALSLWRRFHTLLGRLTQDSLEDVALQEMACILTLFRFCGLGSELAVAERPDADKALEDLLGVPVESVNDSRQHRGRHGEVNGNEIRPIFTDPGAGPVNGQ